MTTISSSIAAVDNLANISSDALSKLNAGAQSAARFQDVGEAGGYDVLAAYQRDAKVSEDPSFSEEKEAKRLLFLLSY